jgi:LysM repeat protein
MRIRNFSFGLLVLLLPTLTACANAGNQVSDLGVVNAAARSTATPPPVEITVPTVSANQKLTTGPTVELPTITPTPTAPPKPTATATRTTTKSPSQATQVRKPSPTPIIHIVEQYDTLLGISLVYEVSVDDLLTANDLEQNDFLTVGQTLIIPTNEWEAAKFGLDEAAGEAEAEAAETAKKESIDEPAARNEEEDGLEPSLAKTAESTAEVAAETGEVLEPAPPAPAAAAPGPVGGVTVYSVPGSGPQAAPNPGAPINPLTGLPVANPTVLTRRPLLVRIGNDPGARQAQKGLNNADLVYEEITEWFLTRLTAVFLGDTPEIVGPIRSVRLVNVQLVPQYQGALAHSGGSDPVRWEVSQSPIAANLDEFFNPDPYFYAKGESWETRLSINTKAARDYLIDNGLDATVTQPSFFFSPAPQAGMPAPDIYIPYPGSSFTEWHYDAGAGKYLRWINGGPMRDIFSGQVAASNVIVYFAEHQQTDIVEDVTGATSVRILVNGAGPAWFFRDGQLLKGYWQTDGTRPPYFCTESGEPYHLKPGNTWVQLVPLSYTIGLNSAGEASR